MRSQFSFPRELFCINHLHLLVYLTGGDDDVDQSVSLLLCYFWVLTERDFMLLTTLDHRGLAMNENEWILEAPKSRPHRPNLIVAFWIRAQCAIWPQIVSKYHFLENFDNWSVLIDATLRKRHLANYRKKKLSLLGQKPRARISR